MTDHVRGTGGVELLEYGDFQCPYCRDAVRAIERVTQRLDGRVRFAFRHFPVASRHPRAEEYAQAAEAAAAQGRFWAMHDALFADQGRLEDPHLWERAERLGLDVARFDADRRSEAVEARIAGDFRSGVRAGVATTPTLFVDGERHAGRPEPGLLETLANSE